MTRTWIIQQSLELVQAVEGYVDRVRTFFYAVVLSGVRCPGCYGPLVMVREAECRCTSCHSTLDPTIAFQLCSGCGGKPRKRIRRYECSTCSSEIVSRFLFDDLVFDADYFRKKMVEQRLRKTEQRARVRQMLAESRSEVLSVPAADLDAVPGLCDALSMLTGGIELPTTFESRGEFHLKQYQRHIQAHTRSIAIELGDIPPLSEYARIDRIWRFIAIIFLAHAGIVEVWQEGQAVMVKQRETDREGQEFSGDLEDAY